MSKHFVWATDIHLDHVEAPERVRLGQALDASGPEAILLTGDISEAPVLLEHLETLTGVCSAPVYFVLGNHDFYRGGVDEVRATVGARFGPLPEGSGSAEIRYLHGAIAWVGQEAVVGTDGWADARIGDVEGTDLFINDFLLIEELVGAGHRDELHRRLRQLGDASAAALEGPLEEALQQAPRVWVLTHIPPFAGACWYEGSAEHPRWQPYFVCEAVGRVLRSAAQRYPERRIEVLCGHTHGEGTVWIEENLRIRTGGATYGQPAPQPLLHL